MEALGIALNVTVADCADLLGEYLDDKINEVRGVIEECRSLVMM
jgi:hypothetical protein